FLNPCSPAKTPFPCTGIAGLIAGTGGSGEYIIRGGGLAAGFQANGSGSATNYIYYIVANDTTSATTTNPMPISTWASTGSDSPLVQWPRVANAADVMTYDVLRCAYTSAWGQIGSVSTIYAPPGGCASACGSVATGLSQSSACTVNGGLVCTYTDSAAASTSAYSIGNNGNYGGSLHFWPGGIVSVGHTFTVDNEQGVVAVSGRGPILKVDSCNAGGSVSAGGGFTSCLAAPLTSAQAG